MGAAEDCSTTGVETAGVSGSRVGTTAEGGKRVRVVHEDRVKENEVNSMIGRYSRR